MINFDIKNDTELIAAGTYFWCSGHLSAVPVSEQSADPRYCRSCFNLLSDELKLLRQTGDNHKKPWAPKAAAPEPPPAPQRHAKQPVSVAEKCNTPKTVPPEQAQGVTVVFPITDAVEMARNGLSTRLIGQQLGFSAMTVSRHLRKSAAGTTAKLVPSGVQVEDAKNETNSMMGKGKRHRAIRNRAHAGAREN